MIARERVRREAEAIEPADVRLEIVEAFAPRFARHRVEMMPPEITRRRACGRADFLHRVFERALAPAQLLRPQPHVGRLAGRTARRILAELIDRNVIRDERASGLSYVVAFEHGEAREIVEAEIRLRVESDAREKFAVVDGFRRGAAHRQAQLLEHPVATLFFVPRGGLATKAHAFVERAHRRTTRGARQTLRPRERQQQLA